MLLTLPIREVCPATPRSRILWIDLQGQRFSYLAGQALLIAAGQHEPRKPYSIAFAPEDAKREDFLELLVGVDDAGSTGPHLTFEPGSFVDVEGPIGRFTFPIDPEERRFVFIAGGTGIAPLRAMLRHALGTPGRQIELLYSARAPGDFAFGQELQSLANDGRIELRQTVMRDNVSGRWTGVRGRIGCDDLAPLVHYAATRCFICGPPTLVEEMPKLLDEFGIAQHRILVEQWKEEARAN